jgi:hypothetical protein
MRPIRVVQNRTQIMVSRSYRGYNRKATPVYKENFEVVIGKTAHRGSVALEAQFETYNPPYTLFRRVMCEARKSQSAAADGIEIAASPTADGTFDVVLQNGVNPSFTVTVTVSNGDARSAVALATQAAIDADSTANVLYDASIDPTDSSRVILTAKTAGLAGNLLKYSVDMTGAPAGLSVTPVAALSLLAGCDAPATAKVDVATADVAKKWVFVSNYPGDCGNDFGANMYAASNPRAMMSVQFYDGLLTETRTFPNLLPKKEHFLNDGSGYGMKLLTVADERFSLYYVGSLDEAIEPPSSLPAAPPIAPTVHYTFAGGNDSAVPNLADYSRELDASKFDRGRVISCPDDDLSAADKRSINAKLKGQASGSSPLRGLRQAVTQVPFGDTLATNFASLNDADGNVVAVASRHTCTFRPEAAPGSYTGDIFVAAAMSTKPLWLSLADRTNIAPVSGIVDSTFNGAEFSLDDDVLNEMADTGHEAVVFDPALGFFHFLTGRTLHPDPDHFWARSGNRQMENQFKEDLFFMMQKFKSNPLPGMFRSLAEQTDSYFRFWKEDAKAIVSYKASVMDKSNNADPMRIYAGYARIDSHWAPIPIIDNIEHVIHTYMDTNVAG